MHAAQDLTATPPKTSPVENARNALENSLNVLNSRIVSLSQRLGPVLGPERPSAVATNKAEESRFHVPIADDIEDLEKRTQAMTRTVDDLVERLGV